MSVTPRVMARSVLTAVRAHGGRRHAPEKDDAIPFPTRPIPFLLRYARLRPWMHGGLLALVVSATACAVAVQYGMKLLVDGMLQRTAVRELASAARRPTPQCGRRSPCSSDLLPPKTFCGG